MNDILHLLLEYSGSFIISLLIPANIDIKWEFMCQAYAKWFRYNYGKDRHHLWGHSAFGLLTEGEKDINQVTSQLINYNCDEYYKAK